SVSPLRTTVTDAGLWPVRRCSNALAAWASSCSIVGPKAFMWCTFLVAAAVLRRKTKKADVSGHLQMSGHVGLLDNGPPGSLRVALQLVIRRNQTAIEQSPLATHHIQASLLDALYGSGRGIQGHYRLRWGQ